MVDCIVTKHSKKRCKERLGLSKKCIDKKAKEALIYGIRFYDASGNLKKYMGYLYESHDRDARNIIIYNRDVYVFKGKVLLTIFHVPKQYHAACDKIQKKKFKNIKESE